MGWASGAWATNAWAGTAWANQGALVTVPDVVGDTQAAATATLQGDGFVVAIVQDYSATVPSGNVASQSPAAGVDANPGSTVTLTISLGPARGGGRKKKKRARYLVEVDGQFFDADNITAVESVLAQSRELAVITAKTDVKTGTVPKPPRVKVLGPSGKPATSVVVQREVKKTQLAINTIYRQQAAENRRIATALDTKRRLEDDDDAVIVLLL